MKRSRRKQRPPLPAPSWSARLMVSVPSPHVGMFRFLLEGYDNLAGFTVLDRHEALLKVFFSPHQEREVRAALLGMQTVIPLRVHNWPQTGPHSQANESQTIEPQQRPLPPETPQVSHSMLSPSPCEASPLP